MSEVVISGIGGRYPGANNTEELWKVLEEGKNVIKEDLNKNDLDMPKYRGQAEKGKFDYMLFGIHSRLAAKMDINTCVILEVAFSAISDAGINPYDLGGKQVAVIIASGNNKYDLVYSVEKENSSFTIVGGSQCMMANRLSHSLNLKGPSFNIDGSWNGLLLGMRYAQALVSSGMVESAVVGCTTMGKFDEYPFHFKQLGRLSADGKTKCFSEDADGYVRSEACVVFYIQRKEDALRVYGSIVDTVVGDNFNKEMPISDLDCKSSAAAIRSFYEKCPDIRKKLSYVECSGEGLKFWDKAELNTISEVLLPGRDKPLLIGSVKSNVGHAEDAAAGVGLVKALLSLDKGIISPNLHYSTPNKDAPALVSGDIKVVTEATKLEGDMIGVNCYRIDGSMSHIVLKRNTKAKKREPKAGVLPHGIPMLFMASARNEAGIKHILKRVEEMPIDEEFIALGNKVFKNVIRQYPFRGYTLLTGNSNVVNEIKEYNMNRKPIWWVFSGMGSQWIGMGTGLMKIPIFSNAIYKCHEILKPYGINLINIITTTDASIFDNIVNSFVGIAAIQIGLVDILNAIGLIPDGILGHSVGELGCAYADGCFSAEQLILAAYARGKASNDADLIPGMMAAVGMGYNEIKDKIPEGIDIACHNSSTSCTLSGPTKLMEDYIASLKAEGIFAKLINASNIAYHSRYIKPAAPALLQSLKKVIPDPKKRSSKWISTSVLAKEWETTEAMYSSAEYHTNNLLSSVLFEEGLQYVPKDAIIVEIAPHGLLQPILKKSLTDATHIPLTHRAQPDSAVYLLTALGKLYLEGLGLNIDKLYPPIEFPVSRGTPPLEPFIFWNHDLDVVNVIAQNKEYAKNVIIKMNNEKYAHLEECSLNGQTVISPAVYLDLIIEHFRSLNESKEPLILKEFKVKSNPVIKNSQSEMYLCLQIGSGSWELVQGNKVVAMAEQMATKKTVIKKNHLSVEGIILNKDDIFHYLLDMGLEISSSSRLIESVTFSDEEGTADILWDGNLIKFLDNILLLPLLVDTDKCSKLRLLNSIQQFIIDLDHFHSQPKKVIKISFEKKSGLIWCEGLEIYYPQLKSLNVPKLCSKEITCKTLQFVPYSPPHEIVLDELLQNCIEVMLQNIMASATVPKINIIELIEDLTLHQQIRHAIAKQDGVKADIMKVGSSENVKEYRFQDIYDCSLIIADSMNVNISEHFLKQVKQGYLLLIDMTPSSFLSIILEQKFSSHSFTLCKLKSDLNATPDFVLLSEECWKESLKKKLTYEENNLVYLVGNSSSLHYIYNVVNEYDKIYNSSRLRYVFVDKLDKFDPCKYKNQLEKNTKILIYLNGVWGTYGMKSSIFNKINDLTDKNIFPFSNLSCQGTKLSALGLNLADATGSSKKLRVIEYVGEKDGVKVCGLANVLDGSVIIHPDKELFWIKPRTWKDSEIASVLLYYSMAYFILKVDNPSLIRGDNIFVNHATHPLSQAIIIIALKNGLKVFTSYKDVKEKEWINHTFPEISEDNIIPLGHLQVDVTVSVKHQGIKMEVLVNMLPEDKMIDSLMKMVCFGGKFYQISLFPTKADKKIGLFVFLKQLSVIGLSPETFMKIPDNLKEKVRGLVEAGLQSREIKPLPANKLRSDDFNIDAISLLLDKYSLPKKAVVDMEDKSQKHNSLNSYYRALPQKSYLIIGDEKNIWIHICQWLIKRGAQNIYLVLRRNAFNVSSSQQFSNLLQQNPSLNLNLLSLKRIKDKESIDNTLKEINVCDNLAAIFCLGKENEETVKNLSKSKEKLLVVSLCAGGEPECEKRALSGLPSLAICTPDYTINKQIILPMLDQLLLQEKSVVYVSELKVSQTEVHDLSMAEQFQSIPSSLREITKLVNKEKTAGWKEVRTNGLKTAYSRELDPVFILTSLKKSYMNRIVQSLMHPAFEAIIPPDYKNIGEIAQELSEGINKFKHNELTIICSDWAWPLALIIAQYLEAEDKTVCIIAIDSAVKRTPKSVIQNYISNIKWKLMECKEENILEGIRVLESRIDLMHFSLKDILHKFKGFLHILKPDSHESYKINKLQQYCENQIQIHLIPSTNFSNMMNSKMTTNIINSLILFEHKTSGKKIAKQYFEKSVIELGSNSNKGLVRSQ